MDHLDKLEAQSIFIFREAFHAIDKIAMLWSFGKDSNVMIHLARKAFLGQVPFPLIHCDTEIEREEVFAFREKSAKNWGVNLVSHVCPPIEQTDATLPHAARVAARKTLGLKQVVEQNAFVGI